MNMMNNIATESMQSSSKLQNDCVIIQAYIKGNKPY